MHLKVDIAQAKKFVDDMRELNGDGSVAHRWAEARHTAAVLAQHLFDQYKASEAALVAAEAAEDLAFRQCGHDSDEYKTAHAQMMERTRDFDKWSAMWYDVLLSGMEAIL